MKKRILKITSLTCLISISMIWYACQKEPDIIEKYEVSFNILSKSASDLKNSEAYELNDAEKVIITVQENDGTPTDYTQYELNVNKLGDAFITKKIALQLGSYIVTEFFIVDDLDSIIFASPLEGSLMAQNVADPLPILFDITEKLSNAVNVEVISTENLKPEDFGLIRFSIIEVETFQFLVNVSELGTDQLLIANLTIASEGYTFSQQLDSIVDNIVTIKNGYVNYILTIESSGYQNYVDTLINTELKNYESTPLIVELEKIFIPTNGLVAYYPFNGNANEESGNGNNGIVYNATLIPDRFEKANKAYGFNGVNNYIFIPYYSNLNITNNITIVTWINPIRVDINDQFIISRCNPNIGNGWSLELKNNSLKLQARIGGVWDLPIQTPQGTIIANIWQHLAITYDGSKVIIYINGTLNTTFDVSGVISSDNSDLFIGRAQDNGWYYNGGIDDIRIYNRTLNEQEIQALYNE